MLAFAARRLELRRGSFHCALRRCGHLLSQSDERGALLFALGFQPLRVGGDPRLRLGDQLALALAEAVELGRALGRLQLRLRLYGIEGRRFAVGRGLSPAVEAAVQTAVRQIESLVESLGRREKPRA
jgi:hypothetical protein